MISTALTWQKEIENKGRPKTKRVKIDWYIITLTKWDPFISSATILNQKFKQMFLHAQSDSDYSRMAEKFSTGGQTYVSWPSKYEIGV